MADALSMVKALAECQSASRYCSEAIVRFQALCAQGDWPAAEAEMTKILAAMEASLGQIMSLYRASEGPE